MTTTTQRPEQVPAEPHQSPSAFPRARAADLAERFGLVLAWVLMILFFSFKLPETFPHWADNWGPNILGSSAVLVVLTLGLLIPLTAGDYDLSVAAILTLSANTVALLNVNHNQSIWVAMLAGLLVGAGVGLTNGAFVVVFGVDSLIATLGMATFLQGIVAWISASQNITGVSNTLTRWTIGKHLGGVPVEFYYGLVLCLIVWYVFEFTPLGKRLLFVGRGRTVSLLSGIKVARLRWLALVASGTIAGFAGVLYVGTLGGSDPTSGTTLLLPALAAAFLGATAIVPGRFNPWGTLIAVYFLATGINGLQLLGVPSYVQQLFYGGALVLAVALSQLSRRRGGGGAGDLRIPAWALAATIALVVAAFVAFLIVLGTTQTS